jgi:hypothetical protein
MSARRTAYQCNGKAFTLLMDGIEGVRSPLSTRLSVNAWESVPAAILLELSRTLAWRDLTRRTLAIT